MGTILPIHPNTHVSARLSFAELPVNIVSPLQDQTAVERSRVLLDCTVSNPRCSIRWYKGPTVILPSERFEICSEGCYRKLIIQPVELRDQGTYSVQVGEYSCSAHLTVEAQSVAMVRPLEDVEVEAPGDACFQCEISHPVVRAPVWSLRGEPLWPSPTGAAGEDGRRPPADPQADGARHERGGGLHAGPRLQHRPPHGDP
ncbi:Obscurin [Merluccius polli]|uniref:Obscurin n=1 Tax=Merluccius polli TaxID=89951 RepID=A0AA47MVI4_MERPO|nr:Obscurin [Merluccius polli]